MHKTIRVATTIALKSVLEQLEPEFIRATGHGIEMTFGPPSKVVQLVLNGERADVVMATPEGVDELVAAGKVVPDSGCELLSMVMGVAVRSGAPKPEISTIESFKRAIVKTASLVHANPISGSPSAAHFLRVVERLGIAEEVKQKTTLFSGLVAQLVADGKVEMAVQQLSELLLVDGVDVVGPFPPELQNTVPLMAAVHCDSLIPAVAKNLIGLLQTHAARSIIAEAGLVPVAG